MPGGDDVDDDEAPAMLGGAGVLVTADMVIVSPRRRCNCNKKMQEEEGTIFYLGRRGRRCHCWNATLLSTILSYRTFNFFWVAKEQEELSSRQIVLLVEFHIPRGAQRMMQESCKQKTTKQLLSKVTHRRSVAAMVPYLVPELGQFQN